MTVPYRQFSVNSEDLQSANPLALQEEMVLEQVCHACAKKVETTLAHSSLQDPRGGGGAEDLEGRATQILSPSKKRQKQSYMMHKTKFQATKSNFFYLITLTTSSVAMTSQRLGQSLGTEAGMTAQGWASLARGSFFF